MKLSQSAAVLCKDWRFRVWLDRMRSRKYGVDMPDGTHSEEDARLWLLRACSVSSRSEIDGNPEAAHMFRKIRSAFYAYARKSWPETSSR